MATERVLISPGVFVNVIDGTFLSADPLSVGAAIIGPRDKGPAMVPVRLKDKDADQKIFGLPNANGRDFSAYAAREYLSNESNPLNFVRVLGMSDTGINPGFNLGGGGLYAIGASGSHVVALIVSSGTLTLAGNVTSSVESLAIAIAGNPNGEVTASLNRSSSKYISKVLNTDPTQFSTQKHFVYAVYDYANKTPAVQNAFFAAAVLSSSNWQDEFITGSSTTIISQPFGTVEYNLFGVGNRFAGASANTETKVSISNIRKSVNATVDEHGTFTLLVRAFNDNDKSPVILESFSNLSLDPHSPDYVCRRIGDMYRVWNKSTKKFDEFGEYENKSDYIYIVPTLDLKNENVPATALPYGFSGFRNATGSCISLKARFPDMPFVNNLVYKNDFSTRVYWGTPVIDNASGALNYGVVDKLKHLPKAFTNVFGLTGDKFSLKWVSGSVAVASGFTDTSRLTDIQISAMSTSIAYNTGTAVPAPSGSSGYSGYFSLENIENTVLAKFTFALADGYDGTDLTDSAPFDPADMSSTSQYQTYAYRTSLDMLANPEDIELTDIAMPGVYSSKVVDYAVEMVESRGDCFYIADISGSSVSDAIDNLGTRLLDTNVASVYYPALRYNDKVNNKFVDVPASTIMPAVFAYSDRVAYPWFAPAGMARGILARFNVVKAKDKLKKEERDRLYDVRINPIASFASSGPVVWGQKTLQLKASALDRVNVSRMVISMKKLIARHTINLVFEPNLAATWDKFVNGLTPEFRKIQQNFGVYDFKIVMDDTTNSQDAIERNQLRGKIAIQPTRTSEFVMIDFFLAPGTAGFSE